jgi:hypothetical protein
MIPRKVRRLPKSRRPCCRLNRADVAASERTVRAEFRRQWLGRDIDLPSRAISCIPNSTTC